MDNGFLEYFNGFKWTCLLFCVWEGGGFCRNIQHHEELQHLHAVLSLVLDQHVYLLHEEIDDFWEFLKYYRWIYHQNLGFKYLYHVQYINTNMVYSPWSFINLSTCTMMMTAGNFENASIGFLHLAGTKSAVYCHSFYCEMELCQIYQLCW